MCLRILQRVCQSSLQEVCVFMCQRVGLLRTVSDVCKRVCVLLTLPGISQPSTFASNLRAVNAERSKVMMMIHTRAAPGFSSLAVFSTVSNPCYPHRCAAVSHDVRLCRCCCSYLSQPQGGTLSSTTSCNKSVHRHTKEIPQQLLIIDCS